MGAVVFFRNLNELQCLGVTWFRQGALAGKCERWLVERPPKNSTKRQTRTAMSRSP